jgi:hypothetical protein
MARSARTRNKLRASTSARSRRKAKTPTQPSPFLIGLIALLILSLMWFYWPAVMGSRHEPVNPQKVKDLAAQHPDAEVFDLGDRIKKK